MIQKYDITIVPLLIHLGEEEYEDRVSITPEEIFEWSDVNKTTPKTAAVSMDTVMQALEENTQNGDEVICFSISNSMSTTGNVMRLAMEELELQDKVHIIDSASLSTGIGLLVLEAATMAKEGISAKKIVEKISWQIKSVVASYVKDMEQELLNAKETRVFITHSGCEEDIVNGVYEYLKQLEKFDEILETRAGGVISSHCGPGTLGVLFIAQ